MSKPIKLLDVVALTQDLPDHGLQRGQVGTVVEELAPGVFEVEFSDDEGHTYAMLSLRADQLLALRYQPAVRLARINFPSPADKSRHDQLVTLVESRRAGTGPAPPARGGQDAG